ncbi:MAG: AmmeMemoRadiSam system protein A [Crenarchaeota archaeon]|nr:AmmeMemoRadiSam system protein A [Thermoproteota archaeon]
MEGQVRPDELTFEEGAYLVRLARRSVEYFFEHRRLMPVPEDAPPRLRRPGAAFVTITTYYSYEHRELRGCIGHVVPVKTLVESVIEVAVEAAFRDPRFPPMTPDELPRVTFEVTVLGPLEPLPETPEGRLSSIVIGRHGLVARRGMLQGLLLPDVPLEYLWDEETFLAETCVKAGMPPYCWLDRSTEFYRYEGRAWRETKPLGEIEERDLTREYRELISRYSR